MAENFPRGEQKWRAGRYYLEEEIGSGTFGRIFTAIDNSATRRSEQIKAIKFIARQTEQAKSADRPDPSDVEAEIAMHFKVSRDALAVHVITTFESFEERDFLCVVMEYCEQTLADVIDDLGGNKLPGRAALDLFHQLTQGVHFLHSSGVIHRDLKPCNILIRKGWVKIADFGTSKRLQLKQLTSTIAGTPLYMSPEMMQKIPHSMKTDIWSLGCILYEMLTSNYVFDIYGSYDNLRENIINGNIPELVTGDTRLSLLYKSLMEVNPEKRPNAEDILKQPCMTDIEKQVKTILLIGKTGSGKSALGNLLADSSNAFISSDSLMSCTQENAFVRVNHEHLVLVDTVGTGDTHTPPQLVRERIMEALHFIRGGVDAVLLCLSVGERLPNEPIEAFNIIKAMFPQNNCGKNGILVLTNTERLAKHSPEELKKWIDDAKRDNVHFRTVLESFSNRVVFVQNPDSSRFKEGEDERQRRLSRQRVLDAIKDMREKKHEFEINRLVSVKRGKFLLEKQIEEERRRQERFIQPRLSKSSDSKKSSESSTPTIEDKPIVYPGPPSDSQPAANSRPSSTFSVENEPLSAEPPQPTIQDNRLLVLKMQPTRVHTHEFFCRRRRCSAWNKFKDSNKKDDLITMLQQHLGGCTQCAICPMCKLEVRVMELTETELDKLVALHEDEVKKMAPKSGGFISRCAQM